jgi:membrane-bound lytic murein transglycosylase A
VNLGRFRADLQGERIVGRVAEGELVPYYSRAEIDGGALDGRNLELLWATDPVDVFFLHVQGSGRVRLPDGAARRIGFAATNGLDFYAIGRALLDEGQISREQASMQAIRDWLRAHPDRAAEVMQRNARYVFFRWIEGDGPIGSQGVALTPGRSLAVDPAFLPLGVPVFLDTTWPGSDRPLRRLMVAQDTGGAIKGPIRGDVFWGAGEAALAQAGRMKQDGRLYLLLPKAVAARRSAGS